MFPVRSFFLKIICIGVSRLCNFVLVSTVQQKESAVHIHILLPDGLPSHSCHCGALAECSVLCSVFSLVLYFIYRIYSVYVSIPISQLLQLECLFISTLLTFLMKKSDEINASDVGMAPIFPR